MVTGEHLTQFYVSSGCGLLIPSSPTRNYVGEKHLWSDALPLKKAKNDSKEVLSFSDSPLLSCVWLGLEELSLIVTKSRRCVFIFAEGLGSRRLETLAEGCSIGRFELLALGLYLIKWLGFGGDFGVFFTSFCCIFKLLLAL